MPAPSAIWTIGHSNRTIELFLEMLACYGIQILVDIRLIPKSRFNPHFSIDALSASLEHAGIRYHHARDLGGRRQELPESSNTALPAGAFRGYADHMRTPTFRNAQRHLLELSRGGPLTVMCAEADPAQCHRSLLADSLVLNGVPVTHILSNTMSTCHEPHPAARLADGIITYPAAQKSLFET